MGFVTHRVVEDRDLNEESNDNLKAENHGHLNSNIRLALNTVIGYSFCHHWGVVGSGLIVIPVLV